MKGNFFFFFSHERRSLFQPTFKVILSILMLIKMTVIGLIVVKIFYSQYSLC